METPPRRAKALGQPRVWIGTRAVSKKAWGSKRALELFFLLLNHPGGLSKPRIGECLFPEADEAGRDGLFHSTLYRCRKALELEVVVWEDDVYRVRDIAEWEYDVVDFEALLRRARRIRDGGGKAEKLYSEALELYGGDYLEGCDSEWCDQSRFRLKQLHLEAIVAQAELAAERGPPEEALELYRLAIAEDYYCEAAHKGVVDCLLRMGDRLAAMRHYLELTERLKQDVPPEERSEIPALVDDMLGRSLREVLTANRSAAHDTARVLH
jgi:two-component SAPR family response regulator